MRNVMGMENDEACFDSCLESEKGVAEECGGSGMDTEEPKQNTMAMAHRCICSGKINILQKRGDYGECDGRFRRTKNMMVKVKPE